MTTDTTASPLESFRQGRDAVLSSVLDLVSGLEGHVLEFQNSHESKLREAGIAVSEALTDKARLEGVLGEQTRELQLLREHVCVVPAASFGEDPLDTSGAGSHPQAGMTVPDHSVDSSDPVDTSPAIAELNSDLEAERRTTAGLRAELESRDRKISALNETAGAAVEQHRALEASFDQRLADELRVAEIRVRGEAIRIIEAIAADNSALVEAADLFTVAFSSEPAPAGKPVTATTPAPAFETEPVNVARVQESPEVPIPGWDTFDLPAQESEAEPAPLTQSYMAATDLDDAIQDPDFFTRPQSLGEPDGDAGHAPVPATAPTGAPKPGYGFFGRPKENERV